MEYIVPYLSRYLSLPKTEFQHPLDQLIKLPLPQVCTLTLNQPVGREKMQKAFLVDINLVDLILACSIY